MIEPWLTPASYFLYRCFHHEACVLFTDLDKPFGSSKKRPYDGNAAIPYKVVRNGTRPEMQQLRLVRVQPFLGLPYLASLGFKRSHPLPLKLTHAAAAIERLLGPVGRWNATRALLVWERR